MACLFFPVGGLSSGAALRKPVVFDYYCVIRACSVSSRQLVVLAVVIRNCFLFILLPADAVRRWVPFLFYQLMLFSWFCGTVRKSGKRHVVDFDVLFAR